MIVIDVEGFESEVLSGWKKLSELLLGTRCMMEATCNVEEHIGVLWVGRVGLFRRHKKEDLRGVVE